MSPYLIHRADVAAAWPDAAVLLSPALATGDGELDIGQLRQLCLSGAASLILCKNGDAGEVRLALAIEFQDFPAYRVGNVIACGGTGIIADRECVAAVKGWLKENGCLYMQAWCKPAQARLWRRIGLLPKYQIVRCEL